MKPDFKKDSIGYLLVQICKLRRNKTNTMLTCIDLHAGQDILLYHLAHQDGQTLSGLVDNICIQPATVSTMIQRMEANGLVSRKKDENDMRVSRIFITNKGMEALVKIDEVWKSLEEATIDGLTIEEKIILRRLLQHVFKNLE